MLILLSVIFLMGCTSAPTGKGDEGGEEIDLLDMEFFIYQINGITQKGENPMLCTAGTDRADMALARIAQIEEDLNCKLTITYKEHTEGVKDLYSAAAVLRHVADVVLSENLDNIYDLLKEELLYDLLQVNDVLEYGSETFDIYGKPEYLEGFMHNGGLFAVGPFAHPGYQLHKGIFLLADVDMISEYAGLDIREAYEKKAWTWSMFENIAVNCTQIEGDTVKVYGGAFEASTFIKQAMGSNGYSAVSKDANGQYVNNSMSTNVINALDWCRDIMTNYSDNIIFEKRAALTQRFVDNGVAMISLSGRYVANDVCYKKNNFSLLPFPTGPMGTHGEYSGEGGSYQGISIYNYTEDPSVIAYIIKAYCQPFDQYPDRQSLIGYYDGMLWDERDASILFESACIGRYDYQAAGGGKIASGAATKLLSMSSAQIIESYSDQMEAVYEEWIIPNSELIDELNNR